LKLKGVGKAGVRKPEGVREVAGALEIVREARPLTRKV